MDEEGGWMGLWMDGSVGGWDCGWMRKEEQTCRSILMHFFVVHVTQFRRLCGCVRLGLAFSSHPYTTTDRYGVEKDTPDNRRERKEKREDTRGGERVDVVVNANVSFPSRPTWRQHGV